MEPVLVLISLASLALNVYIVRKTIAIKSEPIVIYIPLPEREASESASLTTVDSPPVPEPKPTAPTSNEQYSAWVNRKNIPAWESPKPPEPPIPARVLGPRERPDGFV